ncbi:MAG TPA: hypothetical protein VHN14_02455 [Kofleriaceae bacterium]|jgi:hypothetical protein|nr:hypothetical protein [Kofleriaceae bacterium]
MAHITIGIDSDLDDDLTRTASSPPAARWITAMPMQIDALDSGAGELMMANLSTVTFTYTITGSAGQFEFIVMYDEHSLYGRGDPPRGYQVGVRLRHDEIYFDVARRE